MLNSTKESPSQPKKWFEGHRSLMWPVRLLVAVSGLHSSFACPDGCGSFASPG